MSKIKRLPKINYAARLVEDGARNLSEGQGDQAWEDFFVTKCLVGNFLLLNPPHFKGVRIDLL